MVAAARAVCLYPVAACAPPDRGAHRLPGRCNAALGVLGDGRHGPAHRLYRAGQLPKARRRPGVLANLPANLRLDGDRRLREDHLRPGLCAPAQPAVSRPARGAHADRHPLGHTVPDQRHDLAVDLQPPVRAAQPLPGQHGAVAPPPRPGWPRRGRHSPRTSSSTSGSGCRFSPSSSWPGFRPSRRSTTRRRRSTARGRSRGSAP